DLGANSRHLRSAGADAAVAVRAVAESGTGVVGLQHADDALPHMKCREESMQTTRHLERAATRRSAAAGAMALVGLLALPVLALRLWAGAGPCRFRRNRRAA